MFKLPNQQNLTWVQPNTGDRNGSLYGTFNIDLISEIGKMKVSPRMMVVTTSDNDADFKVPFAIVFNNNTSINKWHIGAGDKLFVGDNLPNESFTESAATGAPSFETTGRPDLEIYYASNGDPYTYGMAAELYKLASDGSSWGSAITSLGGSTNGAPLIYFPSTNRLYFRNGTYKMASINQSDTVVTTGTYTLSLNDPTQQIQCGKASWDYIYLGTIARVTEKARVYAWNGSSTAPSKVYEIDAQGVLAMTIFKNTPFLLDSNGVLRYLNGGYFVEAARLPFDRNKIIRPLTGNSTNYLCHYNGMFSDDNNIYILVNTAYGDTDGNVDENVPSGVWVYNTTNGLFHYLSPSQWISGTTTTPTNYGDLKIAGVGALVASKISDSSSNGSLLAGISFLSDSSNTKHGVFINDTNDTAQKAGFFITPKFFSNAATDVWQKVFAKFRKFQDADNKIIIKYRTEETEPILITGTWTGETTFTTETDLRNYTGYEVEVIHGTGSGQSNHITSVAQGTYWTVTVGENFNGVTNGTFKAYVRNWKKLSTITGQTKDFADITVGKTSSWIQFKVWMLNQGDDEFNEFMLVNKEFQSAN